MIERHELYNPELLLDYLLRVNEMLSKREMDQWELMVGQEEGQYVRSKYFSFAGSLCVCIVCMCVFRKQTPRQLAAAFFMYFLPVN